MADGLVYARHAREGEKFREYFKKHYGGKTRITIWHFFLYIFGDAKVATQKQFEFQKKCFENHVPVRWTTAFNEYYDNAKGAMEK